MILTNKYWLVKSNNYATVCNYKTIFDCFSALSGELFDITEQCTILQNTVINSCRPENTYDIIWQHPTDLTYCEFYEQFPEYFV